MSGNGSFLAPPVEVLQPNFAQYKIEEFVAVGGMGAVYRATQSSVDRPVALKILPPEMAKDEAFQKRFAMEAKAMARLSHRNLVQLYDFGETNGIFWMIQEWVQGRTIFEVMHEEERLAPKEAAALVAQACEGLGYAHKQGIVHRDVKPANMMIDDEGILKLMDFGLAGVGGAEGLKTKAGGRYATEEYAAPELWDLEARIDHRVDIFALGVLLYESLTGERPTGTFRMPSELKPGLDARYDAIVVRALQRKRENRYANCEELLKALRVVVTTPPKVKLQTRTPPTDALRIRKPPPPPPPPPPRQAAAAPGPPRQTTGAVHLVAGPAAPPAAAVVSPAARKSGRRGVFALVGVLILLGMLAGGWMVIAGGKDKETGDAGASGGGAGTGNDDSGSSAERERDREREEARVLERERERERERIEREARERAERLARARAEENSSPVPDPDPTPSPQARPVKEVLQALDDEYRQKANSAYRAYADAVAELSGKYLAECQKEEEKAVQAGDLDGVLLWQHEARAIKVGGEAPTEDAGAPPRALALRKAWWARMTPLKAALVPVQNDYLDKCAELHEAAGSESARAALEERREQAAEFRNFLAICTGQAPPFLENPFDGAGGEQAGGSEGTIEGTLARIEGLLPAAMVRAYTATTARLEQLEQTGDKSGMANAIKAYGRTLVRDEKALTRQRKIGAAKAVRRIKEEMLDRLSGIAGNSQPEPRPQGKLERVVIVERGAAGDLCEYDRKEWRRKGRALATDGVDRENGIYPQFTATPSIGKGDFRVDLKLTKGRIGGTSLQVWLGETALYLDNEDGRIVLQRCGASIREVRGQSLGSLAKAETPMEIVIQRTGTSLGVTVNGKPGLQAAIHDRELGNVVIYPGSSRMELEALTMEATLGDALDRTTLVRSNKLGWQSAMTQLVATGNDGLTSLVMGYDGNADSHNIIARRSRDGGKKWDDPYAVIEGGELSGGIRSFAAACDPRRDHIYLVVGSGRANQQISLSTGRNGGRNWSKPVDITATAKQAGWNVWFGGEGLVISRGEKNPGRVILPMMTGQGDTSSLYMLVSDDSGRAWKPIGPLTNTNGAAELMEDERGVLWAAVGGPSRVGTRMIMSSSDGGDTWSEPAQSTLPDARHRGSLILGEDSSDRPVWYYASSVVQTDDEGGTHRTHLTLYGSRDQGKSWKELRRMHFGGWSYPSAVSLGPGRCGIGFRRDSHRTNYQQIHFVAAGELWGE